MHVQIKKQIIITKKISFSRKKKEIQIFSQNLVI